MGELVGYARVSTEGQDLSGQLEALREIGCKKIFGGKQSGRSRGNQKKLEEMLSYIREGDLVVVSKLDRLGRSLRTILNTIEAIHQKGAALKTLDGAIDTSNGSPFSQAMVSLIGTFAQLERDLIVDRTAEGREQAKRKGVKFGRKPSLSIQVREEIRVAYKKGMNISQLAKKYSTTRQTVYRVVGDK